MLLPNFIDATRYTPVFTTEGILAQEELRFIRKSVKKGEFFFFPKEKHRYTYHIVNGLVRLYISSRDGIEKTLHYHAPETQFGFQGFKRDGTTRMTAVAVTDCEVLAIDYVDLLAFCDRHTNYYLAYIEYLFQIMSSLVDDVESLSFEVGARRLASLLYALAVSYNMKITYSIDELASIIGTHRNTVTNALSHFRSKGYLAKQQRSIVITDLEGLNRYIQG